MSALIPFRILPSSGIVEPGTYFEEQTVPSNPGGFRRALIIGPVLAGSALAATGKVNVPVISAGPNDAIQQAGAGSVLARMTQAYVNVDNIGEIWYLPVVDDPSSTPGTGSILFTGPSTAAGVLSLYINYTLVSTAISSGMTAAQIATAVVASINANTNLPVTAAIDGIIATQVDLTSKNKGLVGNEPNIQFNYLGAQENQVFPAGVGATITAMTGGSTNANLTTALANCGDVLFDFIALGYNDTISLNSLQTFLSAQTGRWEWSSMLFGCAFTAYRGTYAAQTTLGASRNDAHMSIMGFGPSSPSASYEWAASIAAAQAVSARANPAQGNTIELTGIGAPLQADVFTRFPENNTLLQTNISTFTVNADNSVSIDKLITTYQTNSLGQPDTTLRDVETLYCIMVALRAMSASRAQFARRAFNDTGVKLPPGSDVVTLGMLNASDIATYTALEQQGIVQNSAAFAATLVSQQNANNPNRIDSLWPFIMINRIDVMSVLVQLSNY